jgi:hypothetical protein
MALGRVYDRVVFSVGALSFIDARNKLDASGGSVFVNLLRAAQGALNSRHRVNSTVMPTGKSLLDGGGN